MFLALRELRHAKLRFFLLAGSIGLLVFLILVQLALRDGLVTQFIGAIRHQSAPVLVYGDQARQNLEGSQVDPSAIEAVAAVEGVARVGRFGEATFTVSTPTSRAMTKPADRLDDAVIFGYEIGGAAAGLGAPTTLVDGRLPEAPNEAVASDRNRDEGFDIGDVIRVEPGALELTIVGVAEEINYSVAPTLFVAYESWEAAKVIRNPDAVRILPSVLVVEPEDGTSPTQLTERIDAAVDGVETLTRQQAVDESPGVASVRSSLGTVIALLQFTVLLVVGLFLLILTTQKAGPLTLLRAMGASAGSLVCSLLIQAVVIVLGGIAIGTALLFALLPVFQSVVGAVPAGAIVRASATILGAALVGSVFAIWRVLRIEPVRATQTTGGLR
ncbi:MAG: ABC transporter permease [Acidimicrobiia bacterium]